MGKGETEFHGNTGQSAFGLLSSSPPSSDTLALAAKPTFPYDNPAPYAQAQVINADVMNRRSVEPVSALSSARGSKSQQGKWGSACAVCATAKVRREPTSGAPALLGILPRCG